MERRLAEGLAQRLLLVIAEVSAIPTQALSPSRDYDEEGRIEQLRKDQPIVLKAAANYLAAFFTGVKDQSALEAAGILDEFFGRNRPREAGQGIFERSLAE